MNFITQETNSKNSILLAESHEGHLTRYIVPEGPESMIWWKTMPELKHGSQPSVGIGEALLDKMAIKLGLNN